MTRGGGSNYLLSGSYRKTLNVSFDEVQIFARPMEYFEAGIEFVQKRFAGAIEMIRNMQWAWCQRSEYLQQQESKTID